MNRLLFLALILSIYSCDIIDPGQKIISQKLEYWDTLSAEDPASIIDSLNLVNTKKLSAANSNYLALLLTIAHVRTETYPVNTPDIERALVWFRKKQDFRNVCRALIFRSVILTGGKPDSNNHYKDLKEAEEIFNKRGIKDTLTEAYLNMYLSQLSLSEFTNRMVSLTTAQYKSDTYFEKSVYLFKKLGMSKEAQNVILSNLGIVPATYQYDKEFEKLKRVEAFDTVYPQVLMKFYEGYANYFISRKDYRQGLKYLNTGLSLLDTTKNIDNQGLILLLKISNVYRMNSQPDSAVYFAKLYNRHLIRAIPDSHMGYLALSTAFEAAGNYEKAYEAYKQYYRLSNHKRVTQIQDLRLQNELLSKDYNDKLYLADKQRWLYLLIAAIIVMSISGFYYVLLTKRRRDLLLVKEAEHIKKRLKEVEMALKREKFVSEVVKVPAAALPAFVETITKEAGRCRKISPETFENVNNHINALKQGGRDMIGDISKSELFEECFPKIATLKELSGYEKLILALFEAGFQTKEIANLIANTPSSVRSIKAKIKEKLPSLSHPGDRED